MTCFDLRFGPEPTDVGGKSPDHQSLRGAQHPLETRLVLASMDNWRGKGQSIWSRNRYFSGGKGMAATTGLAVVGPSSSSAPLQVSLSHLRCFPWREGASPISVEPLRWRLDDQTSGNPTRSEVGATSQPLHRDLCLNRSCHSVYWKCLK